MGPKPTRKTAYYFRAINRKIAVDLQSLLKKTRQVFGNVAASEITLGAEEVIRIQHYRDNDVGVFLHLVRYLPGEKASTLLPKSIKAEDDEGSHSPPTGTEYKDGDSFLLVKNHNVIFCSHGISVEKSRLYLAILFEAAKLNKEQRTFDLAPASNIDKLNLLRKNGVKSIELGTNAYDISLHQNANQSLLAKVFGKVADELKALLEKDDNPAEQKVLEDLLVNVELRLDGNTRAAQVTQDFIEQVAESVLEEKDNPISEFTIITQTNDRITSDKIRLQDSFLVPKEDGSVSHTGIWDGLEKYLTTITQGNLVEQ